jgi:hypothetical protein
VLKKSSFLSLLCFRPYERGTQQYVWNTDLRAREERVGESGVKSNSEEKFSPRRALSFLEKCLGCSNFEKFSVIIQLVIKTHTFDKKLGDSDYFRWI